MIAGHLITVVQGKRPKTYIVCEADPGRAVEMLREKLGAPLELPLSPMAVSRAVTAEHGIGSGEVKLLHL